jgi:hypothetical protein
MSESIVKTCPKIGDAFVLTKGSFLIHQPLPHQEH